MFFEEISDNGVTPKTDYDSVQSADSTLGCFLFMISWVYNLIPLEMYVMKNVGVLELHIWLCCSYIALSMKVLTLFLKFIYSVFILFHLCDIPLFIC